MQTTNKSVCTIISDTLVAFGVEDVIISPGSRNAPLIVALARQNRLHKHVIVDERTAAYAAVGIIQCTRRPVAIVCTSGTAMLNYSPALAEAYYQNLPLIAITADRPEKDIDQNDGQTIRQQNALSNIVNASFHIPSDAHNSLITSIVHEAISNAIHQPCGPVHINVPLTEPLYETEERPSQQIELLPQPEVATLTPADSKRYAEVINQCNKVLIVASFGSQSTALDSALSKLAEMPNIAIMAENISNIHSQGVIYSIERVLSQMSASERTDFAPDLLIYFGGTPTSRVLKQFLRTYATAQQWRIGVDRNRIDTMHHLTESINVSAEQFFNSILPFIAANNSDYAHRWATLYKHATVSHNRFCKSAPWSDFKAMSIIMPKIPADYCLQLSNGTAIRYSQLFDNYRAKSCHCNRGVSGIDGSTSTALGFSIAHTSGGTLLITGDMSFGYDLGGLATPHNSNRLKIIVLDNQGGNIFRFMKGASTIPEREDYLAVNRQLPIKDYAKAFGFKYFEACNAQALSRALNKFFSAEHPAILAVKTDPETSAATFRNYYKRNK